MEIGSQNFRDEVRLMLKQSEEYFRQAGLRFTPRFKQSLFIARRSLSRNQAIASATAFTAQTAVLGGTRTMDANLYDLRRDKEHLAKYLHGWALHFCATNGGENSYSKYSVFDKLGALRRYGEYPSVWLVATRQR